MGTPPRRHPVANANSGATLGVAMSLGMAGLICCAAPLVVGWHRGRFAAQLSVNAEAATGEAAELRVRRLAEGGIDSIRALVRLAGSSNPAAAAAARDAVEVQIAGWETEFAGTRDTVNFGHRVAAVANALAAAIDRFDAAGRAWARRIAMQLTSHCDRLAAPDAAETLVSCDRVLAAPERPAAAVADASGAGGDNSTPVQIPPPAWQRFPSTPPVARPAIGAAQPLADAAPTTPGTTLPHSPGDARFIDPPSQVVLAPHLTPTASEALGAGPGTPPSVAPLDNEFTAAPLPGVRPLPRPEDDDALVSLPPPHEQRAILRKLRELSEAQLTTALANARPHQAQLIQQVLSERSTATARGPSGRTARPPAGASAAIQRQWAPQALVERVSALPAAEARKLLRQLVADPSQDPETRAQALTLLATSGDPELAEIARQRAVEDADPRVADLALKILRESQTTR